MEDRTLGDYRLIEVLADHPTQTTWRAEQVSIRRPVVLVELTDLSKREVFLAEVRAKASVDHPLVGSVYEAVSEDDCCFVAMEHLRGSSLAERASAHEPLRPVEFAHLLRRLAEAMLYLAGKGTATEPLGAEAVHLDPHGVIRIENIAASGEPDPTAEAADLARLGAELTELVADGHPGTSRILTVLAWMRGEGIERQLTWEEVRSYGEQIEGQLVERPTVTTGPHTARVRRKFPLVPVLGALTALVLLVGAAVMMQNRPPAEPPAPKPTLPPAVALAAGDYPSPDGGTNPLGAFRISACEVTIGEYQQFLDTLERLEPAKRTVFDLDGQPSSKTGHEPDDWAAMFAAAETGESWQGRSIDLMCPVVGVDWWDAAAYCEWKRGRLPNQAEWFAALREKVEKPEFLQPAPWGPVTGIGMSDRTPNGLRGMAGSVAEWTARPELNPANPLGARRFVIIGASFLKPGNGALAREWTDDRLQRRPDLGFRIVFGAE